ncbi:MAG: 39S ribosomal protein L45 [Azoarcus sp.]|jgi:predicted lipid-binding transport protein (Tim44 family)|nr:39S ribosomal protein L45 [Azoarcus sp.]
MKHVLFALLIAVFSLSFLADDAYAARFGGGRSFGMKRSTPPASAPRQNNNRPQQGTPPAGGRSWMGPLAGLATGIGLAALLSHFGLGEDMASFVMLLLLAAAAVFLFRKLRRGNVPAQRLQYAGAPMGGNQHDRAATAFSGATGSAISPVSAGDFDVETFIREAKLNFIRLQTANDAGNLDDIREFTTPEVYAEISLQTGERGGAAQQTDVVELDAEVVDLAEENGRYVVSVRFSGLLREEKDATPAPFAETWHLVKPMQGGEGWRIAGIQQAA